MNKIASALLNKFQGRPLSRPLHQELLVNMYCILFTFHSVLNWVEVNIWPIIFPLNSGAVQVNQHPTNLDISQLRDLRTHIATTASGLLKYFPSGDDNKELQTQWNDTTLKTKILPENILELSIQCLCSSLGPEKQYEQKEIATIVEDCFGASTTFIPHNCKFPIGLPVTIFLGLDQLPETANENARYVVGATQGRFPSTRVVPGIIQRTFQNTRVKSMKAIPGTSKLQEKLNHSFRTWEDGQRPEQESVHSGQSYGFREGTLELKDPCEKCCGIYRTPFPFSPPTNSRNKYALYTCAEEAWALKVNGGVMVIPSEAEFEG